RRRSPRRSGRPTAVEHDDLAGAEHLKAPATDLDRGRLVDTDAEQVRMLLDDRAEAGVAVAFGEVLIDDDGPPESQPFEQVGLALVTADHVPRHDRGPGAGAAERRSFPEALSDQVDQF